MSQDARADFRKRLAKLGAAQPPRSGARRLLDRHAPADYSERGLRRIARGGDLVLNAVAVLGGAAYGLAGSYIVMFQSGLGPVLGGMRFAVMASYPLLLLGLLVGAMRGRMGSPATQFAAGGFGAMSLCLLGLIVFGAFFLQG